MAQRFYLLCSSCSAATYFYSSSKDRKNAFDVNLKSLHASCQGTGLAGITKIAGILDLPPPVTAKAYNNIVKTLSFKSTTAREKVLNEPANNLKRFTQINNPENIININNKQVAKVAVIVDCTWQKRGHNSKFGVIFILSVDTCEVLDVIVKCLFYTECNHNKNKFKNNIVEFNNWYSSRDYVIISWPKDGWCNFWKSRDNHDNEKRLPTVFYDLLEPIFQRLSKNDLLNRCLRGMTQNKK